MADIGGGVRLRGSDRATSWAELELRYMPEGATILAGMLHARAGAITVAVRGQRTRVAQLGYGSGG